MRAKDVARLAGMVTDDVVFLPARFPPIRGKQAVEATFTGFFAQFSSVEQTATVEEVQVAGEWAFLWGSETMVLVPNAGGPSIQMQGKGMSILRRQTDGSWKFARGINNSASVKA
ncbi:putative ketosteroid isomerase homolog protein [Candidatus Sulfopaludibacter sp. SbA3]|nr:putative ketosteroid isomerase homolog protein [Candidatus Sulfopaludibacter sp. SbA3]